MLEKPRNYPRQKAWRSDWKAHLLDPSVSQIHFCRHGTRARRLLGFERQTDRQTATLITFRCCLTFSGDYSLSATVLLWQDENWFIDWLPFDENVFWIWRALVSLTFIHPFPHEMEWSWLYRVGLLALSSFHGLEIIDSIRFLGSRVQELWELWVGKRVLMSTVSIAWMMENGVWKCFWVKCNLLLCLGGLPSFGIGGVYS